MGRHASTATRSPVLFLSVLLVIVLIAWFAVDFIRAELSAGGCDSTTVLNVAVAPDIAPYITQAGNRASEEDKEGCYQVNVISRESVATAESLAVSDGSDRPDAWIPESTMWVQRAQGKDAQMPAKGTSIASSPVVLALTETAANQAGWPDKPISWAQVIGPGTTIPVGFPDPAHDPVGTVTLLGLRELAKSSPNPGVTYTATMRKLSANTVARASDLDNRLPGGTATAEPISAFPTSEAYVVRHNAKEGVKLAALYADPPVPSLDFPYVILPDTSGDKRGAAERFRDLLTSPQTVDVLADAGFRTPDGKVLRDRSQDKHTSAAPMALVPLPDAAAVEEVLSAWAAVNLSGRIQMLVDVSGSMQQQVPGTNMTRMALTTEAAAHMLTLFKPTTRVGWWLFSTNLDGPRDYVEWQPVQPVSEQLTNGVLDRLRTIRAVPNGHTGLYDSMLAAYQEGTQHWEAGRINAVIILTDGKNDDPEGPALDQTIAELTKLRDPRRPLPIIGIGIGPDVDPAELAALTEATGGKSFVSEDPAKVKDVFYSALNITLCQPPTCTPPNGGG
jgi:hypothetical protein